MQSLYNVILSRSNKFIKKAVNSSNQLVRAVYTESCNLAYTAAGLNQMFGNNFKKVYFDQDKECAEVLYEFLSVGRFDVTGGQSDIEEMLRTIATA